MNIQRLTNPLVKYENSYFTISWVVSFNLFLTFIFSKKVNVLEAILGKFVDLESTLSIKSFFNSVGCSNLHIDDCTLENVDFRMSYLLNTTIVSLEMTNLVFLFGTNLRVEAPLLNTRLRKNYLLTNKQLAIFSFGLAIDYLTYPVLNMGNSFFKIKSFLEGRSSILKNILFNNFFNLSFLGLTSIFFTQPKFMIGLSVLTKFTQATVLSMFASFILKIFAQNHLTNMLNIVSPYLGRLSAAELGIIPGILTKSAKWHDYAAFYFCNVDDYTLSNIHSEALVVYQGSFALNSALFQRANIFWPSTTFAEMNESFINIEGRLRKTKKLLTAAPFVFSTGAIFIGLWAYRKIRFMSNFSILKDFSKLFIFNELIKYDFFNRYTCNEFSAVLGGNIAFNWLKNIVNSNTYNLTSIISNNLRFLVLTASNNFFFNTIIKRTVVNYIRMIYIVKIQKLWVFVLVI